MWDLAMLAGVPGFRVAAPRDPQRLRELLHEAVDHDGPAALRFPKAQAAGAVEAIARIGEADVLHADLDARVLVVAVGPLAAAAVEAARSVGDQGIAVTVVDPRWVLPVDGALTRFAAAYDVVVTVEDGVVVGGVGDAIARELRGAGSPARVVALGLPPAFVPHGTRAGILAEHGLDALGIEAAIRGACGAAALAQPKRRAIAR
jgi:1-deoxy-D-xylulose-5-phosphate synthase